MLHLGALSAVATVLTLALASLAGANSATTGSTVRSPTNVSPPSIEGEAQEGQILRAEPGRWQPKPGSLELSYQWESCAGENHACSKVPKANDRIYALRREDIGRTIRVIVTATNDAGSPAASSEPTPSVSAAPEDAPHTTLQPAVAGKTEKGELLTAQRGEWTGAQPIRVRYRWRRCDADGGACEHLGREGATYVLRRADVGHSLRALVLVKNRVGTSAALSDPTGVIGPISSAAPKNTSLPTISGVAQQGKTLTASSGSWIGTERISFSFQWLRCRGTARRCSSIRGHTAQAYTVGASDVRRTLRVRVAASNSAGKSSAVSDATDPVIGLAAPRNTSPPTISGVAREGSVLAASTGSWAGAQPIRFSFEWLRCGANGASCARVPGATGQTRALTASDVGHVLRIRVRATNAAGSSSALSSPSALVAPKGDAPRNTQLPILSGSAVQGERLHLTSGSWSGSQPITHAYEWVRCSASLGDCASVQGATGSTYVVSRADVAHRLFGVVTARNSFGSSRARSNATPVIVGAPVNVSLPTISGRAVEGEILTASPGSWTGPGPISFGYQWTRCTAKGDFERCVPIVVTSNPAYRLTAADVGRRLFVQVKAQNRFGATFVNSALTATVGAGPARVVTIRVARRVVTYGSRLELSGVVVNAQAGERVNLVERPLGATPRPHTAMTAKAGVWRYAVRPMIRTSYEARIEDGTSAIVTVQVRPRLRFGRVAPGRYSVQVHAARSFAGRFAVVQRWNRDRQRWIGVRRIYLRATGLGVEPTEVSRVTFRMRAPRGRLLRVVLPSRQAGPGYLQGVSNRVRVQTKTS